MKLACQDVLDAVNLGRDVSRRNPRDLSDRSRVHAFQVREDDLAIERLAYAGFRAEAGEQGLPIEEATRVTEFSSSPSLIVSSVAQALGLGNSAVELRSDPASPFVARVTLGADYRPCYDPTRHQPG